MAADCILCGAATNLLKRKKTKDGMVCSVCMSHIPKSIKNDIKNYSFEDLRDIVSWVEEYQPKYIKKFEETASYGNLHIDEYHGLFAICEKKQLVDGNIPDSCVDIFHCLDLEDVGIATKHANANENSVNIDVELMCVLSQPSISFKKIIKSNVSCAVKRINSETLQYSEPEGLSIFRNMFNQMYKTALEKYNFHTQNDFLTKHDIEVFAAKSLFMLEDGYTKEELKQQRNRMLKVFHPDESRNDTTLMAEYTKKINDAYKLLVKQEGTA